MQQLFGNQTAQVCNLQCISYLCSVRAGEPVLRTGELVMQNEEDSKNNEAK